MSEALVLSDAEIGRWRDAIGRWNNDAEPLRTGLLQRWSANATGFAPAGLPKLKGPLSELGWSQGLELFLLSFEAQSPETDLVVRAVSEACDLWPRYNDAWLADVLALRRAPPPVAIARDHRSHFGVDLDVAWFIVGMLHRFARDLPKYEAASFAFIRRLHNAATNALVSEIVEAGDQGSVWLEFQIGRRLAPPNARSVFRSIATRQRAAESAAWPSAKRERLRTIQREWATVIAELVGTIVVLNEGLAEASRDALLTPTEETLEAAKRHDTSLSRQFDFAFYRLILADRFELREEAELAHLDRIKKLITLMFERLSPGTPLFGLRADPLVVHGKLWEGVDDPLASAVGKGAMVFVDGVLNPTAEMIARVEEEAAL